MPDGTPIMSGRRAAGADDFKLIGPGLAIVAATYGLARYGFGLFVPEFEAHFGIGPALLGWIASASYASYMVAAVFASWLSGHVGPRLPVVMGGLSAAVGMAIIAAAETPALLAFGVIIAGASPGLAYPPLSDAVVRMIDPVRQNRTYTIVNSGTSLGVLVAAPVALMAGAHWRSAWAVFAILAVAAMLWNARHLPNGPFPSPKGALPRLSPAWYFKPGAVRLFTAAMVLGLATAVYWTFAVDLIDVAAPAGDGSMGQLFWAVLGIAGFGGAIAGDVINRIGLRHGLRLGTLGLAASIALLGLAPASVPAIMMSAVLFGMTFIMLTGMLGVWSIHVFRDRPAAGFGATFLIITLGQMIAPALIGSGAAHLGFPILFLVAAATVMLIVFLVPARDIRKLAADQPATAVERPFPLHSGYAPRTLNTAVAVPQASNEWSSATPPTNTCRPPVDRPSPELTSKLLQAKR